MRYIAPIKRIMFKNHSSCAEITSNPKANNPIININPNWVPTTFKIPALVPKAMVLAIIRVTVGPGTTTTTKQAKQ